jgi:hypothetical protein
MVCAVACCGCGRRVASEHQRFVPLPRQPEDLKGQTWQGTYALDTKTGQLCVPWDCHASVCVSKKLSINGGRPVNKGSGMLQCLVRNGGMETPPTGRQEFCAWVDEPNGESAP